MSNNLLCGIAHSSFCPGIVYLEGNPGFWCPLSSCIAQYNPGYDCNNLNDLDNHLYIESLNYTLDYGDISYVKFQVVVNGGYGQECYPITPTIECAMYNQSVLGQYQSFSKPPISF